MLRANKQTKQRRGPSPTPTPTSIPCPSCFEYASSCANNNEGALLSSLVPAPHRPPSARPCPTSLGPLPPTHAGSSHAPELGVFARNAHTHTQQAQTTKRPVQFSKINLLGSELSEHAISSLVLSAPAPARLRIMLVLLYYNAICDDVI